MGQSYSKAADQRRQEEKEEVSMIPNWSELCPDLLQYVFKRLSFTDFNRAKLVCSSWYSASIDCVSKNQIPWLILFPRYDCNKNNKSCVLFVPDDKDNVCKTGDLGVEFFRSRCLATYGSWLLMILRENHRCDNIYILNPLTRERIDLPDTKSFLLIKYPFSSMEFCFWIDNKTKDYLVVWRMPICSVFTKKGVKKWHEIRSLTLLDQPFYNHKNQKLYVYKHNTVKIWDFSRDIPCEDGFLNCSRLSFFDLDWENLIEIRRRLAVTKSGDLLMVACCSCRGQDYKTWRFGISKKNHVEGEWARMDSLGDEAMILDMGITVDAKNIPGIKRNSIYFSGLDYRRDDPNNIFVFDLTTQKMEPLPQCVFSSIQNFSHAQWFFPGFSG